MKTQPTPKAPQRKRRGFQRTSNLLQGQINRLGESRGFAVSRLLTHWAEIVGEDTAAMALPVKVGYGRGGMGATLTVLTTGARAPMLQAELPKIRDRVNACYGYGAIARIKITQTAPTGFAEGQVAFAPAPKTATPPPNPEAKAQARAATQGIDDDNLRRSLDALGESVLSRVKQQRGSK